MKHLHYVYIDDVIKAVNKMKCNKRDETCSIYSDHIINADNKLYEVITLLFNTMIIHGVCPQQMLQGEMIPLPKVKGTNNSDQFRAITLGSLFCKLFDFIILDKFASELSSSDLQFGFKHGSSTSMCSFVLQEIIAYYNEHNSPIFCLTLDASKAFDRVKFDKLFLKLIDRNLCPVLLRLMLYMYTHQSLNVKWNNSNSSTFCVSNGVKQGAVLSSVLFNLYTDELLNNLKNSHVGCHIGNMYCGALAYADDIVLLCPSVNGMNKLIKICEDFANDHSLVFNANKSEVMYINNRIRGNEPNFVMNNQIIPRVSFIKHLGHVLDKNIGFFLMQNILLNNCINQLTFLWLILVHHLLIHY